MDRYDDEREIDLIQYIYYLWRHVLVIIVVTIICAAISGGYSYYKQTNAQSRDIIAEIVEKNKKAATDNTQVSQYTLTEKIDGTSIVKSKILVDFNFSRIERDSNFDYGSMVWRQGTDATGILRGNEALEKVVNKVNNKSYGDAEDITVEDLSWMINASFDGANIITYYVTDENPDRAMDIANELNKQFLEEIVTYKTTDNAEIVEEPSIFYTSSLSTPDISTNTLIKYALIGAIAGLIVICGMYFLIFFLKDAVYTPDDIKKLGMDTIGVIPYKNDKREIEYNRFARKICNMSGEQIVLAPVDDKTDITDIFEYIVNSVKESKAKVEVKLIKDIVNNSDYLQSIKDSDKVILVARYGETKLKDVKYSRKEVSNLTNGIMGTLIVENK